MSRELVFGDLVKIHSLVGMKVLNGSIGLVLGVAPADQNPDNDRYEIHVKNQDNSLMIRKTNLTPLFDTYRVGGSKKAEGKGVFALRDISAGEIIFRDKSLLRIPEDKLRVFDLSKPNLKAAGLYAKSELSPGDYSLFSRLVGDDDGDKILRNIFEPQAGILFLTAMINHSCAGNANYEFDEDDNSEIVYAIRDIKEGEEIFHSYVSFGLEFPLKADRQQELLTTKKFACRCDLCAHPQSDEIDATLKELSALQEQMIGFLKLENYSPSNVDVVVRRMIDIATKFCRKPENSDDDKNNRDESFLFPQGIFPMMRLLIPLFAEQAFRIAVRFQNADKVVEWSTKYVTSFSGTHPTTKYWTNKVNLMSSYIKNPSLALKKK